jgi:hypothetical protein
MSQEIVPDGKLGTADLCSRRTVHGLCLHDKHLRRICQVVAPERRNASAMQMTQYMTSDEPLRADLQLLIAGKDCKTKQTTPCKREYSPL